MASQDGIPKEKREWLVMLYMAGDNNLDHEMVLSLQFLLEVGGLGPNIAIVAEFDSSQKDLTTRRYDFTKPTGHRLKDYLETPPSGETSTGNPQVLTNFLDWAETK